MSEYQAQLIAVEAKLAKDADNEELLSLKADLLELIELSNSIEDDELELAQASSKNDNNNRQHSDKQPKDGSIDKIPFGSGPKSQASTSRSNDLVDDDIYNGTTNANGKRPLTEVELLARKKEKNRKKKAKLREKIKVQLDIAETEKQTWQSFANKKGLKGVTKKSIFASPISVTGKVGVGTNGIADAPSMGVTKGAHSTIPGAATSIATKRRH